MVHSILSPSKAAIWGAEPGCRGYLALKRSRPLNQVETNGHLEGTASHEVGETIINSVIGRGKAEALEIGQVASNGELITEDIYRGGKFYADTVLPGLIKCCRQPAARFGIEHRLPILNIHSECFGTCDLWFFDSETCTLKIFDYKYGFVIVEAFKHWQSICYFSGIADLLNIHGISDQKLNVEITVIQPRALHAKGPVRSWRLKAADLRGYINIMRQNAEISLAGTGQLSTGGHCRFCELRVSCPARLEVGFAVFECLKDISSMGLNPRELGGALDLFEEAYEVIKSLKKGFQEVVKARSKSGTPVPGWDLEPTSSRLCWTRPHAEIVALGHLAGLKLEKDTLITPTQAVDAGIDPRLLTGFAGRHQTGFKLKKDDGEAAKVAFQKGGPNVATSTK